MFRFRWAPLRAAALLAAGFVLLRVLYRLVFGGVSGNGLVLLDLPRLALGGPFSHISLFGPVTTGGVGSAAASALPVAAIILGFGLLNAVVNVQRVFARGVNHGPLRAISRSLVIAWATFPALLESVRRVRIASRLRGERSAAALLVPVFEQTIERALALAASMEVRGLAATETVEGACEKPIVLRKASLDFGSNEANGGLAGERAGERAGDLTGAWRLDGITLNLAPGTLTVITGRTGSGKTSLLHSLSGLFQHFYEGTQHGLIEVAGVNRAAVPPRNTAGFVGLVMQNVRLSFLAETVHDEIGFSLAVRGVAPVIVDQRVREVGARLGILPLLPRPIEALSAGEASLVAIAAALVARPILLLVDEPLADLDAPARLRVVQVLGRLARDGGVCVVVAEHNTREWHDAADAWLDIQGSQVRLRGPAEPAPATIMAAPRAAERAVPVSAESAEPFACIRNVTVLHGSHPAVSDVSLNIHAGEVIALEGANGAGKSSLLQAIALPTAPGSVVIDGKDVSALGRRTRRFAVALVPENFADLLFGITVAEECRRADQQNRRARRDRPLQGSPNSRTTDTFRMLLGLGSPGSDTRTAQLLRQHPRDLSAGERLCLVIAIQLSADPAVLLIDEPTRGLDADARALVAAALRRASSPSRAVLFATHDRDFARGLATRSIRMEDGRLLPAPLTVTT